ncbi:hypothetical protein [Herpetosiphon geysericola]|nr:hypothetical protein [Herpetosiphon geysericola]
MKRLLNFQSIHSAIPYLILGFILVIQGVVMYSLNAGKFMYTLDDPYIHLALARNIYAGHYGLQLIEPSAPSSSILWPFILALFAPLAFFEYIPLILNILFGFGILFFISKSIRLIFQDTISTTKKAVIISIFIIISSLTPLIWSGMEHILQILLTSILIYNVLELEINNKLNKSIIITIMLSSLIRYENLAISVPLLIYLYFKGYRLLSLLGLILTLAPLAAFSYFLHRIGLSYLPTSVIIKTSFFSSKSSFEVLLINISFAMQEATWYYLLGLLILIGIKLRQKSNFYLKLTIMTSIVLQLIFGTTLGSFHRYETFMFIYATVVFIYLYRNTIQVAISNTRNILATILLLLTVLIFSKYIYNMVHAPAMSNSIYSQQYQMALFASKYYNANVGVNDIGLVSYFNPHYTLDLFGLSNIDVIDYRRTNSPNWMETIASQYDVNLIMIYDSWFKTYLPSDWTQIGKLHLESRYASVEEPDVSFYVRDPNTSAQVRQLLEQFSQTLPKGTEFRFAQE